MGLMLHHSTSLNTRTLLTKSTAIFITSSTRRRPQQLSSAAFSSAYSSPTGIHLYSHRLKQHQRRLKTIIPTTSTFDKKRFLFTGGSSDIPTCSSSTSLSATVAGGNNNSNVITSPKSATVKKIQALLTKRKKRTELNQAIVEGPRMVYDLLENPITRPLVQQVLISTESDTNFDDRSESLLQEAKQVQYILPEILKKICSDTVTPQGIIAIVDIPDFTSKTHLKQKYPLHLLLDGVSDPGNVGTLIRSSLAVGVESIILLPGCCDVWNPKAIRSAMGASFQISIIQASSFTNAMELLSTPDNEQQQPVERYYAATMLDDDDDDDGSGKSSIPHFDVDWTKEPTAIIIGSEGNGLSDEIRNMLLTDNNKFDISASHIPMTGSIESLNAAVCGSVILFEYQRQCEMTNRKE